MVLFFMACFGIVFCEVSYTQPNLMVISLQLVSGTSNLSKTTFVNCDEKQLYNLNSLHRRPTD